MSSYIFIIVLIVIFLIYGALNYYIGRRGRQAFGALPYFNKYLYWILLWIMAYSYLLGRFAKKFLPLSLGFWITTVGSYWLAAMVYFIMILVVIDLVRLVNRFTRFIPASVREHPLLRPVLGALVVTVVAAVIGYGHWNARHARVTSYEIAIPKKAGPVKRLHAVMAADLHLGTVVDGKWLNRMVDQINGQKPDIVLLPGDIIDEAIEPAEEPKIRAAFQRIKAKYGVYMVPGNHEYISGDAERALKYLKAAGVKVLRDSYIKVDSFYIVGRDDRSGHRRFQDGRKPKQLTEIMQGVDRKLPVILLDHMPAGYDETMEHGVDLQLSGHTHAGQLWPDRMITSRMYEIDWGHLQKGSFHAIVTSGFGLWGPPIRTGNYPEIVDIMINFGG